MIAHSTTVYHFQANLIWCDGPFKRDLSVLCFRDEIVTSCRPGSEHDAVSICRSVSQARSIQVSITSYFSGVNFFHICFYFELFFEVAFL
jgi:hypothetical protein